MGEGRALARPVVLRVPDGAAPAVRAPQALPPLLPRYVNRELSWLEFDRRVLAQAADPRVPLLERLRFLAIFESNLDEFYMVRVSGLAEQVEAEVLERSPDGLTPAEQLRLIAATVGPMRRAAAALWDPGLRTELAEHGIQVLPWTALAPVERQALAAWFRREVFPVCTPLVLHPSSTVPFISNRSLNLAVRCADDAGGERLARVKIPTVLPRLVPVPGRHRAWVLLEDLTTACLDQLFPGVTILGASRFRVIRDADIEIRELEAGDLIERVVQTIRMRRFGSPVLLEASSDMPDDVRTTLARILDLDDPDAVLVVPGLLGLEAVAELARLGESTLRHPPHQPHVADGLAGGPQLFATIRDRDVLVHHPFDGFRAIEAFVAAAARDPAVIGIKQTLYRVGAESPLVESLLAAAEAGKQVAVLVELKARFDESNNLGWARALERAGVHVTYGFPELKTHAKLCAIVRRDPDGIRTYAHVGTGNYNPTTARLYTDLGLFTCDPAVTEDVLELFNVLTGFSRHEDYRRLLVAPLSLRREVVRRIEREAAHAAAGRPARIVFKLNALADPLTIDALYVAAAAGVSIDLVVRGICCLRPNVERLSRSIRVRSIVGRFLEHSRILYFENGGEPEVLIGSADLMPRNLDRRIEVMVPIRSPELLRHLREDVLQRYLDDTENAWEMCADGSYRRIAAPSGTPSFDVHTWLMGHPSTLLLAPPAAR